MNLQVALSAATVMLYGNIVSADSYPGKWDWTVQDGLMACQKAMNPSALSTLTDFTDTEACLSAANAILYIMSANCVSISADGFRPNPQFSAGSVPSTGAAIQAYLNTARDNPATWGYPFHLLFMVAVSNEFPCPDGGRATQ